MPRTAVPLLLLFVLPTAACGKSPCATYAEKLCTDLGAGHEECENARRAAEKTTDEMRTVCEEALRSYDEVLRVLRRPAHVPPPPAAAGTIAPAAPPPGPATSPSPRP